MSKSKKKRIKESAKVKQLKKETISLADLLNNVFNAYGEKGTDESRKECLKRISIYLKQEVTKFAVSSKYNILVLYDTSSLIKTDADRIYNAITRFPVVKPLLMIIYSKGGEAGSAYLIGKLCREYSNNAFIVTVPRHAKSAATLICCAANEIHMGSLSELGPIDPQIEGLPALGLKYSVEHLAELVKKYPESYEMFAKYMRGSLKLINLGYYERVAESAVQYAEKLLHTHQELLPKSAKEIAQELVYKYKDHGFVIDKAEAKEIFGINIIKKDTSEYQIGNTIYKILNTIMTYLDSNNYYFYFIGSLDTEATIVKRKD